MELQQTKTAGRHQYDKRSFTGPDQDKLKLNTPGTSIGESRPAQRTAEAPPPANRPAPGNPRTTNPYAKPHPDRCFHCHEVGHRSNNCPARSPVGLIEGQQEQPTDDECGGETFHDDYGEVELLQGDEGERVVCIIEKLLLLPKKQNMSQRNALFRTRCTIKQKVCDLIIDSSSTENIVSKALVKALGLTTERHPQPYSVSWVKRGIKSKITEVCRVPFSIGNSYHDTVLCDVLDMDACHIILGRPWQFDRATQHKGRENTCLPLEGS